LNKLSWEFNGSGHLGQQASIQIPVGYAFLGASGTKRFLEYAFRSKTQPPKDSVDADARSSERPREPTWFEVLGVQPTATIDEIKIAYRERALQYHPDRVQGLGQEFQEIAERKIRELNLAYQSALQTR
jgi:DnaJ domain